MSKGKSGFGDIIQQARKQENQNTGKPENRNAEDSKPAEKSRMVNVGVKVSEERQRHWAAEAKRKGKSMTAVIIAALVDEFGEPE